MGRADLLKAAAVGRGHRPARPCPLPSSAIRRRGGQVDVEDGAAAGGADRPQAPTVRLDDRPADAQPHAGAVRLGRKERIENPFRELRRKPDAGIADGQQYLSFSARCEVMASSRKPSTSFIASMLLTMRFIATCCNCTRSPTIGGRSSASSIRTDMLYRIASPRRRATVSRIISFTPRVSRFWAPFRIASGSCR